MVSTYDTTEYDSLYTALITPFQPGGFDIDEDGFRSMLRYYLDNDAFRRHDGGFIVNPEAGEIFTMSPEERARTIEITLDESPDDVNVFAGVYHPRREDLIADAEQAIDLGVDGIFVMPPAGSMEVTTTIDAASYPEIWVDHVRSIAEVDDVPLIVHPTCPPSSQYGEGLPLETTSAVLEEVPSVVGWKMTYNWRGHEKITRYIRSLDRHVGVLTAPGDAIHNSIASGYFDGTVSGSWNYALEPMIEHVEKGLNDDIEAAREIWDERLADLHRYIYGDFSRLHVRYKVAAWLRGLCSHPYMRPPMPDPLVEEIETLSELLSDHADVGTIDESDQERIINELEDRIALRS